MQTDSVKKEYEISFVLENKDGESAVANLLAQYKAEVYFKSPLSEIRLSYPIKKHLQAVFGYMNFKAEPDSIDKLTRALRLSPAILRILIITPPVAKPEKGKPIVKSPRVKLAELSAPAAKEGALTNKALEEKLEEILK